MLTLIIQQIGWAKLHMNLKSSNAVNTNLTLTSVLAYDDHPSCFYHGQLLNSLLYSIKKHLVF